MDFRPAEHCFVTRRALSLSVVSVLLLTVEFMEQRHTDPSCFCSAHLWMNCLCRTAGAAMLTNIRLHALQNSWGSKRITGSQQRKLLSMACMQYGYIFWTVSKKPQGQTDRPFSSSFYNRTYPRKERDTRTVDEPAKSSLFLGWEWTFPPFPLSSGLSRT